MAGFDPSIEARNLRLTAIRSFMRYASLREPTLLPVVQRVLAIPVKRFDRPILGYLSREEVTAIIDAPPRCAPTPSNAGLSATTA